MSAPNPQDRPQECDPTYTLDRQIARARADMGPERWEALQAEWNDRPLIEGKCL